MSLSLQTDNFTRNIRSVNKQIAEAESKFKLAAALSTQLSTLERRLSLQKDAVTQYERALAAANGKLQECFTHQTDCAQRLTEAKTAQEALKEQVAAAAQQVRDFSSMLGENDSATIAAKASICASWRMRWESAWRSYPVTSKRWRQWGFCGVRICLVVMACRNSAPLRAMGWC